MGEQHTVDNYFAPSQLGDGRYALGQEESPNQSCLQPRTSQHSPNRSIPQTVYEDLFRKWEEHTIRSEGNDPTFQDVCDLSRMGLSWEAMQAVLPVLIEARRVCPCITVYSVLWVKRAMDRLECFRNRPVSDVIDGIKSVVWERYGYARHSLESDVNAVISMFMNVCLV